jgi:hypothetical protein
MKVFVVYHQNYIYADPKCYGEGEYKYLLNENWEIKGVFSTKEKAEQFIDKNATDWAEDEDWIEHYKEWHYFTEEFEVDG